jgi:ABC-2 type transport system permease protein
MEKMRIIKAELLKTFRQSFFSNYMIFFNLAFPFGLGLTFYFIYLPFDQNTINIEGFEILIVNFTLSGQIVYMLFINMLLIGVFFSQERLQGTLEAIFLTPCNKVALLLGGSLAGLINYIWFILGIIFIMFILHIKTKIVSYTAVMLSIILVVICTVVVGMMIQAFFIASRRGSIWATLLQEPMIFVSGIVFPVHYAPLFIQIIASAVPLSYSVLILRLSIFAGATFSDLSSTFFFLIVLFFIYLGLTIFVIRLVNNKLRKEGSIQLF